MDYEQLILVFTSIVYEALPFIVLGVILAGLLEEFVPQQAIAKVIPANRFLAIGLGGVLGLIFPMCECGIIVVMKRLLRKGLPLSVCVAYMLAGPIINFVVMISTYVAFDQPDMYIFGHPMNVVLLRIGLAFVIALVTGLIVDRLARSEGADLLHPSVTKGLKNGGEPNDNRQPRTWRQRLGNITETALHDFVDILAFLILGAILAAGGRAILQERGWDTTIQQSPPIAILLMMLIAVLFCLCSEADAFVAANFQLFWPPASKMAFLVLGPMLDIKLLLMYTRVFRRRLILTIVLSVVIQVFAYTMILHYLGPTLWDYWQRLLGVLGLS